MVTVPWGEYCNFSIFQNLGFFYSARKKKVSGRKLFKFAHCIPYLYLFSIFTGDTSPAVYINLEDRRKRDTQSPADLPYTDDKIGYNYQFQYTLDKPRKTYSWPTPSGITQEEARKICLGTRSLIENYSSCGNTIVRINVEECIEDIKVRQCVDHNGIK